MKFLISPKNWAVLRQNGISHIIKEKQTGIYQKPVCSGTLRSS